MVNAPDGTLVLRVAYYVSGKTVLVRYLTDLSLDEI